MVSGTSPSVPYVCHYDTIKDGAKGTNILLYDAFYHIAFDAGKFIKSRRAICFHIYFDANIHHFSYQSGV